MKWILCLVLLLLTPVAFSNNVLTNQFDLNLVRGQEFLVPKGAIGAYALKNDKLVEIVQKNGKVSLTVKAVGFTIVQVLHNDGTISNYRIKVQHNEKTEYFSQRSLYKGYNFVWTNEYLNFQNSSGSNIQNSRYRGKALLTTKVGTTGKFLGLVEYRELYPTYFYVRGDFKKAYVGYGDMTLQLNPFKPNFITQPRLRQHTAGWDGESFDLDLWSGQLSPIPFSNNNLNITGVNENDPNRDLLINDIDTRFSGGKFRYKFKGGDTIYASTWFNHEAKRTIPYIGYTYTNNKYNIVNSTTIGNTPEAPVFANKFSYRAMKNKWTLQTLSYDYIYAIKGFDNLLFSSRLPMEMASVNTQFFSGDKFNDKGSSFLNFGYGYSLNGFNTNNQYSGTIGWKNSKIDLQVDGSLGTQEFTYLPNQKFNNWKYTPSMGMWLTPMGESIRYKVNVSQSYGGFEFVSGENKTQETTLSLSAKHKNGFAASLGIGRFNVVTPQNERNGIRATPRIDYRKDNIVLYAQGNLSYIDNKLPSEQESSYVLGQERYSGGLKYTYNQKHIVEGRYIKASDGINNREYSSFILGYTLRLGHPSKSVLSILDSKKIEGVIFEDLNLNGFKDFDEKGIDGIKVVVESNKGGRETDITNGQGKFKISGLKDDIYSFSTEGDTSYTLSQTPGVLNLKTQEGYFFDIPAVKTKNVEVFMAGESDESFYVSVSCAEKENLNKVPMQVGRSSFIAVPVKNDCSISVNLLGTNQNVAVFPDKINTKNINNNEKTTFELKTSNLLLGQVFLDKNKNGHYEFGEELTQVEVIFDKFNLKTDENGIFTTKVNLKDSMVKFIKVKGRNCRMKNPEITDFSGKKIFAILCHK